MGEKAKGVMRDTSLAMFWGVVLFAAFLARTGAARGNENGEEPRINPRLLLASAFENLYADDYIQTIDLISSVSGARPVTKKLQILRHQSVRPGKALVRFLEPAEIRRTGLLIMENENALDDVYVYLPALRIVRRISAAQRSDSFFGTDLDYEDIEPKLASEYEVRDGGRDPENGGCARLELQVRSGIESTYERMIVCVEIGGAAIRWIEYIRSGRVVKRLEVDPVRIVSIGGRKIPFEMTMNTLETGSSTRIVTEEYELVSEIPESLFSARNLEAGDAKRDRMRALLRK